MPQLSVVLPLFVLVAAASLYGPGRADPDVSHPADRADPLSALLAFLTNREEGEGDGSNCENPERIYDVTIVYGTDAVIDFSDPRFGEQVPFRFTVFDNITEEKNTLEFRTFLYDFAEEQYGVKIDPEVATEPVNSITVDIPEGSPSDAFVFLWSYRPTLAVYAIDVQGQPKLKNLQGKIPVSNAEFIADGVAVVFPTGGAVAGKFADDIPGADFVEVSPGSGFIAGEQKLVVDGEVVDTSQFFDRELTIGVPGFKRSELAPEVPLNVFGILSSEAVSENFGKGLARGVIEETNLVDEDGVPINKTRVYLRYVLTFPQNVEDTITDDKDKKCSDIRA
ncbi:unnamed protein product [Vitrella brassicaformis CCMP3155]|uniref:Uncharacterized protein n=2 Tax=Vitrella brassicaformis TaxID=1169539 RepID=A0A0G4EPB0_VITBC|nr:unnamed protein product [Vitrella brassicaformis CCMP3155]|eukprot:CEL98857.1 unnamed protein product [Vitrella brassicaformis CCMP3155]